MKTFSYWKKRWTTNVEENKVFPGEIEEIAETLKIVNNCIAFPVEDDIYGHRVGLLISLISKKTKNKKIKNLLNEQFRYLPDYKKPYKFWILENLPYSKNGKKIRNLDVLNNLIKKIS